jgi:hypothetical protein
LEGDEILELKVFEKKVKDHMEALEKLGEKE